MPIRDIPFLIGIGENFDVNGRCQLNQYPNKLVLRDVPEDSLQSMPLTLCWARKKLGHFVYSERDIRSCSCQVLKTSEDASISHCVLTIKCRSVFSCEINLRFHW